MKQNIRTRIVRNAVGVAALAMLAAACSGSDGGEAEVTTPVPEESAAPLTAAPETLAPPVTEPPVEETTVDTVDIPDLPCAEYVEESGYPLTPCDSGVLVETLQRDLESLFPAIFVDGLFGNQTFGFVTEFQTSNGLEATGVVSEELAEQIAAAESLGDSESTDEAPADTTADATESDTDAATVELCNDLIGNADDPDFTAERIEECSDLGVDIVGEG